MKKIYLAGPDVFLPNAIEQGECLKKLCRAYGFKGCYPMDNLITGSSPQEIAKGIGEANQKMIEKCDIVIANLSPFRGPEPDSGTVWEVGYAQGLGKQVLAYSTDRRSLKERTQVMLGLGDKESDHEGMSIEDFGLSHNLMFAHLVLAESFEECLKFYASKLNSPYYVYILRCSDTTLYTGIARDLEKRVLEHNSSTKGAKYTASRRPVSLVYSELCEDRSSALKREIGIKKMSKSAKEQLLIAKS